MRLDRSTYRDGALGPFPSDNSRAATFQGSGNTVTADSDACTVDVSYIDNQTGEVLTQLDASGVKRFASRSATSRSSNSEPGAFA